MLTSLYSFLLRLRRRSFPHELAQEMFATFEAARDDASSHGWLAFLRFGARELAGLAAPAPRKALNVPPHSQRLRWISTCALAGGAIAGFIAYATPARYTSFSTLRINSPIIPERYVPSLGRPDLKQRLQDQVRVVLSRRSLTGIMQRHNLYQSERARMPLEEVVELMRRNISIRSGPEDTAQIAFTYPSALPAQRVAREILTGFVDECIRSRTRELQSVSTFLHDRAEAAAQNWMDAMAAAKSLRDGEPAMQRAQLDIEMARQEYQSLRAKIAEVQMAEAAAARNYDSALEVLDVPSFPESDQVNRVAIVVAGILVGLLLGALSAWIRSVRPVELPLSAPRSA